MGKLLYSSSHDRSAKPERKRQAKPKPAAKAQLTTIKEPLSISPTEAQRQALRARQVQAVLSDVDMLPDHRRKYVTQDGVNYSEPRVLGPRMDLRTKARTLPGDPDLEESLQEDAGLIAPTASGERIADVSLEDQVVLNIDNALTKAAAAVNNLQSACQALLNKLTPVDDPALRHNAERMFWIVSEAVGPWLKEVDGHLDGVIQATPEKVSQKTQGEQNGSR